MITGGLGERWLLTDICSLLAMADIGVVFLLCLNAVAAEELGARRRGVHCKTIFPILIFRVEHNAVVANTTLQ